ACALLNNSSVTIPSRRNKRRTPNIVEPEFRTIVEVAPMVDNRIMKELLQAPTEGYGEVIVIPKINADHFETKINLLQLGSARVWYDKEPPHSILTWEVLLNKLVNQFFPPSKTTHLTNEISRFTQRFEVTFGEAWEQFKEMLRACPHHGFTELAQIDTFYNGLNDNDQDSLNATMGGNLLSKTTREALQIIKNKSKFCYSRNKPNVSRMNTTSRENASKTDDRIDKLADQILTLVDIFTKKVVTSAPVKAVEESYVTCGGPHAYYNCDATNSNQPSVCAVTGTYNQVAPQNRASNYMAPPGFAPNQSLTSGTLSSNTIPNPKGEMKAITTRSGVAYEGPSIPTNPSPKKKKVSLPELTPTRMTLKLADRSITHSKGVAKNVFVKVGKFHFPTDFVVVDFEADPRVPLILGRSLLRTGRTLIDVYGKEITLRVNDEAVTFNLNQTTRYSSTYDDLSQGEVVKVKSSIEEPPELELKELPSHLEYAYLEGEDKLPVIIAKDLKVDEKEALLKVLKSHKRAIAWKITNIKGIDPRFCTHKILMEEDYKPAISWDHSRLHEEIDFANFHAGNFIVKGMSSQQKKKLFKDVKHYFWDDPYLFRIYAIKSFGGVCMAKKLMISLKLVMKDPPGAIMVPISLPRKQVEVSNQGLKRILEREVGENRASWSEKLDDALWDFRTAYKTPIGCTPYKLQLNELNELRDQTYKNSLIYKEKTKKIHDSKIKNHIFNVGDQVLLFNSHLKIFTRKLKTRWSGPFTITNVFPYGTVELSQPDGPNFKVNGHRVKHYFGGDVPQLVVSHLQTFPMDK
nr:reverse transcriptase domain-containing protein [Tanacetum cinerariifolium]